MNFKNLTFKKVLQDAQEFKVSTNNSYIEVYPEFLNYFNSLKTIEKHHLIISSHFVYGWMPTIIKINTQNIVNLLVLLNRAKSGCILDLNELNTVKKSINNSMVGLSKLLHFINPNDYAIWDSRIYKYITGNKTTYGLNKAENYLSYLTKMKEIIGHKNYSSFHELVQKNVGYPITPMRAVEILMFEAHKNQSSDTTAKSTLADRIESEGLGTFEQVEGMTVEYEEVFITKEQYEKKKNRKDVKTTAKQPAEKYSQMPKTIPFSKSGVIDPEQVKAAVYNQIDFELPQWLWVKIDQAFSECWNNEIGVRGWVHEGQLENYIYNSLHEQNIMFEYVKIVQIVKIIYGYIEMSGGFLE